MTMLHEAQPAPLPHPEVVERLSHVAMLHELSEPQLEQLPAESDNWNQYYVDIDGDSLTGTHVKELGSDNTPEGVTPDQETSEKSAALQNIRDVIAGETAAHGPEDKIDWSSLANTLLDKTQEMPDGPDKNNLLIGSVVSSRFASDPTQSAKYIKSVYAKNRQSDLARACESSELVMMLGSKEYPGDFTITTHRFQRVKDLAPVFEMPESAMQTYVDNVVSLAEYKKKTEGLPTPKRAQKDLVSEYDGESPAPTPETQEQAVTVSMSGEKITGSIVDIHKIERFALQEIYIKRQMKDVLNGIENGESALEREIDRIGAEAEYELNPDQFGPPTIDQVLGEQLARLTADAQEGFRVLSVNASKEFSLDNVDISQRHLLTKQQQVALRYREVSEIIGGHAQIARFIDPYEYMDRKQSESILRTDLYNIDAISSDGAAAPETAATVIGNVMRAAIDNPDLKATPDELYQFTHTNRRKMLALATSHDADVLTVDIDNSTRPIPENKDPKIIRDENGKLKFENDFLLPEKGALDVYSAVTLGCPALRLQHENRALMTVQEKAALGSSNFVDHALAAEINSAYKRGLFSVENLENLTVEAVKRAAEAQSSDSYL